MNTNLAKRLGGKVILVAGAGGIGDGLVMRYAAEGASVVVGDINARAAERVADEANAAGGKVVGIRLDGADEESIAAMVARAVSEFGGIDGLHANFTLVGSGDFGDILELPMEEWDQSMSIDARGYVLCTRHVLPEMRKRGGGSIVYTSSDAVYMAEPVRLAYAMTKSAIGGLVRNVAARFGPEGIRANVISCGLIWHKKLEQFFTPEMVEQGKQGNALKTRLGTPEDIAAMGALLLSDEGGFITGQSISVNGGALMRA